MKRLLAFGLVVLLVFSMSGFTTASEDHEDHLHGQPTLPTAAFAPAGTRFYQSKTMMIDGEPVVTSEVGTLTEPTRLFRLRNGWRCELCGVLSSYVVYVDLGSPTHCVSFYINCGHQHGYQAHSYSIIDGKCIYCGRPK